MESSEALGLLPGGHSTWTHNTVSGQNWLYKSCAHCVLYSRYKAGVFPPYIHSEIGNHWTDHADNCLEFKKNGLGEERRMHTVRKPQAKYRELIRN